MKKYLPKGFTMIELLIVIAVLGVLAVAVLSAINPIEQINRGRDTGSRSDAEQLLSAIDRYNAAQLIWPWQCASDSPDAIDPLKLVDAAWVDVVGPTGCTASGCSVLGKLSVPIPADPAGCVGTDEIKQTFVVRLTNERANNLHVFYRGDAGDSVYVCFNPQSGSFSDEATRRCDDVANPPPDDFPPGACAACPEDAGDNKDCICLP